LGTLSSLPAAKRAANFSTPPFRALPGVDRDEIEEEELFMRPGEAVKL
jgi:hypothetical protein